MGLLHCPLPHHHHHNRVATASHQCVPPKLMLWDAGRMARFYFELTKRVSAAVSFGRSWRHHAWSGLWSYCTLKTSSYATIRPRVQLLLPPFLLLLLLLLRPVLHANVVAATISSSLTGLGIRVSSSAGNVPFLDHIARIPDAPDNRVLALLDEETAE